MSEVVTVVRLCGIALRRSQVGRKVLWQAASADPTWGYWYATAREAVALSSACDRPVQYGV